MYTAISLTNKNETKCGLQNKNYAKMIGASKLFDIWIKKKK